MHAMRLFVRVCLPIGKSFCSLWAVYDRAHSGVAPRRRLVHLQDGRHGGDGQRPARDVWKALQPRHGVLPHHYGGRLHQIHLHHRDGRVDRRRVKVLQHPRHLGRAGHVDVGGGAAMHTQTREGTVRHTHKDGQKRTRHSTRWCWVGTNLTFVRVPMRRRPAPCTPRGAWRRRTVERKDGQWTADKISRRHIDTGRHRHGETEIQRHSTEKGT